MMKRREARCERITENDLLSLVENQVVEPPSRRDAQDLRLLPDRDGYVALLRAFGELVFWQERDHHMLAPPLLIYAELLSSSDPRAHEAAAELRKQFLT
jgi:hypothetical protein